MVVPADWKEVRLGDHAAFFKGNGLSKSQLIDDGPQQCVHYGELFTHYGPVIETVTSKCVAFEGGFKSLAGDVLMPGSDVTPRGLATASAIKVSDVVLGGDVIVIRTKPTSLYGPFLSNFIRMSKGRVLRLVKGSTVYHIHAKDLADLEVLMPPLKEQEAIAEALSDADATIESLDALIAKKRDVKQAMMQQLLTGRTRLPGFTADWNEVRLGDLGSTFGGLTGKSSKDFGGGNSSFVTFMNVMSNVVLNNQGTEKVRIGNGERQSQLLEGDVIFNGSSETPEEVGFGSAVPIELSGLFLNSFCFGFRRKDTKSLDPKFFAYLTRSPLGRDIIRPMAQGSTRYNIAKTNLLNGRFPLPPLKEQEAISEALTVMDDELEALTEQVSKLRMVMEGMMQDLLTGKVRLV